MLKIINYILRLLGSELLAVPYNKALSASAKEILEQTSKMDGSGEFKRAQALRALINRHPEMRERDCALAIELALL